ERRGDRVGISRAGQMVAVGTVDELRTGGAPRWRVDAPAAPVGWVETAVPGARVVRRLQTPDSLVVDVELPDGRDGQEILHAAIATGPVREFGPVRTPLTELFRHVVSAETTEARSA